MMLGCLALAIACVFGAIWGVGENRCWKEAGEAWILKNFKLYHLLMGLLFGTFNAFAVCLIFGLHVEPAGLAAFFNERAFLLWLWLMLWDTLILDVVWWLIRFMDITHLGQIMFAIKFLRWEWVVEYPQINEYDYGKGKPWHDPADWDNCPLPFIGRPPLVFGCYWWWAVFAVVLVVLGVVTL
jgi:hypothetical protein